jgi:hypothetical protein
MRKNIVVVFTIACVSYGQRKYTAPIVAQHPLSLQARGEAVSREIATSLDAVAMALLAFAPQATFNPSRSSIRSRPRRNSMMIVADDMQAGLYSGVRDMQRREMLARGVALLAGLSLSGKKALAAEATLADLERLGEQAKMLRAEVRKSGSKAADRAATELETVLQPLQQTMKSLAPNKKASILAGEMKAHLAEYKEALELKQWEPYVSKTTKDNYPGGRPERELEEVQDTYEAYLKLVKA